MNIPDPNYRVQEFARRTRINLEFIEDKRERSGDTLYEATQLINSMLGLLIFPVETLLKQLERDSRMTPFNDKPFELVLKSRRNTIVRDNIDLLWKMRNAFAHGNVDLGSFGEIDKIELWSYPRGERRRPENEEWRITIRIVELRNIVLKLCDILEKDLPSLESGRKGMVALAQQPDLLAVGD